MGQNYYNKRKLAQDGQALHRKKKSASGSKKSDADYELLAEEEVFNGRYKVNGKRLGMVRVAWRRHGQLQQESWSSLTLFECAAAGLLWPSGGGAGHADRPGSGDQDRQEEEELHQPGAARDQHPRVAAQHRAPGQEVHR